MLALGVRQDDRETILSWCDKLVATPAVGIKVDFHFDSIDSILHRLSPMLSGMVDGERAAFTVDRRDPFQVNVSSADGFLYSVDTTKIFVAFQYSLKVRTVSGQPPIAELTSQPMPYTQLLAVVGNKVADLATLLCAGTARKMTRVGIVANAAVSAEEVPPGITRFIAYMARPWKGAAPYYSWQVTARLADNAGWSDRCIHTLLRSEDDPEQLIRLTFDWQRNLTPGRAIAGDAITQLMRQASDAALQYFEELGEGNQFDEQLIGAST